MSWHDSFSRMKQRPHVLAVCPQAVAPAWLKVLAGTARREYTPWRHQSEAAAWAAERHASMLALDMGTGKTLTALLALGLYGLETVPVMLHQGANAKRAEQLRQALLMAAGKTLVVVVNYDSVWRGELGKLIDATPWAAIILDESHRIKSPGGRASRWLARLAAKHEHAKRLCLTGTPMPHALAIDCRVLTPTGWRVMGELSVGDQVIGSTGAATEVVGVWPQGVRPMFRVSFSDGCHIDCTADHLWSVTSRGRECRDTGPLTLRTDELDQPRPAPRSNGKPGRMQRKCVLDASGAPRWGVPLMKSATFANANTLPVDPYLLGALLGDGSLGRSLGFTTADQQLADEVAGLLPKGCYLTKKPLGKWNGKASDYRITSKKKGGSEKGLKRGPKPNNLMLLIDDLGLRGTDCYTKFVPHEYLFASARDRLSLLQGLCDTDGSSHGSSSRFTSVSPRLADGVRFLVRSLGGIVSTSERSPREVKLPQGGTCVSTLAYVLTFRIPVCPFRLLRKRAKWSTCTRKPRRGIVSVDRIEEKEAQCITVAASDGLFVADHFVVTHNSPLDLYGQFRFLDAQVFGTSYTRMRGRYAECDVRFPSKVKKWRNQDELAAKLDAHSWRVTADEVLDLPDAIHDTIPVPLSAATMRFYRQLEKEMVAEIDAGSVTAANALTKLLRLAQATGGYCRVDGAAGVTTIDGVPSKRLALQDRLEDLPETEPAVVFCRFRSDLDDVQAAARELGREYAEVSGERKDLERWQAGDATILGVQMQSGGVGIDLSRAAYAFYYSLGYSLGDYEQSLARLRRPGQTRCVRYYHLVCQGTVDEQVYAALRERRSVVEAVLQKLSSRQGVVA